MKGLAKTNDSLKYEIPNIISVYFGEIYLSEGEILSVLWRNDIKQLQFIYSVYFQEFEEIDEIVLNIYYLPYQKRTVVHPLCVVSSNNIYGDMSRKATVDFFHKHEVLEKNFYARVTEVFETALIENWRLTNPDTLFQDTLGKFEIVYEEGN